MNTYVIWLIGSDEHAPCLCYKGRDVFCTTLLSQAQEYVKVLENDVLEADEECLKGLFVIKQLADVEE